MDDTVICEDFSTLIPARDWKYVEALRKHFNNYKALECVKYLDSVHNFMDKESSDGLAVLSEQEYAIAKAFAEVMDLHCSKCFHDLARLTSDLDVSDISNGCCPRCKTPIVKGE